MPSTFAAPVAYASAHPESSETGSATAPLAPRRIEYIDATRGVAMCFACSSHFAQQYLVRSGALTQAMLVQAVCMLASPTFMIVSGALVGYMHATRPERFAGFRAKLVDRGAFLLLVGHLLILIPKAIAEPQVPAHTWVFVTDVIGLSVVSVPWIVPSVSGRVRLWLGLLIYAASALLMCVLPATDGWRIAPGLLWGSPPVPSSGQLFPLMPWISVYIVGTVLGERIARWRALRGDGEVARRLSMLSASLVAYSLIAWRAVRLIPSHLAHLAPLAGSLKHSVASTGIDWVNPWQKLPPGPGYLALQSGLGLGVLAALAALQGKRWIAPVFVIGTALGRASLFIFVLQFYVYNILMRPMRNTYTDMWPAILVMSLALLVFAAMQWNRYDLNRYFTLGIERLLSARARRVRQKC